MHGFQSGETVTFKEVNGMISLNGRQSQIDGNQNTSRAYATMSVSVCLSICL